MGRLAKNEYSPYGSPEWIDPRLDDSMAREPEVSETRRWYNIEAYDDDDDDDDDDDEHGIVWYSHKGNNNL